MIRNHVSILGMDAVVVEAGVERGADMHPLVSLISACFWAICAPFSSKTSLLLTLTTSMAFVLGKGPHCVLHNNRSEAHLFHLVLLDDTDGEFPSPSFPANAHVPSAQFLVIHGHLRSVCCGPQLLAQIPVL